MDLVLITTCFNRANLTYDSLRSLKKQSLKYKVDTKLVLVDDGCTDNTVDLALNVFPDAEIIKTGGGFFWSKSLKYGLEKSKIVFRSDAVLFFNDDVIFHSNAIEKVLDVYFMETCKGKSFLLVGQVVERYNSNVTAYGGKVKRSIFNPLSFRLLSISDSIQTADAANMNCVLIPTSHLSDLGGIPNYLIHGGADYYYSMLTKKMDGEVYVLPGSVGFCDKNSEKGTSREYGIGFINAFRRRISTKEYPFGIRFKQCLECEFYKFIFCFLSPYLSFLYRYFKNKSAS